MNLITPKVEIIPQGEGIDGIFKQIEIAGRTCYKSENKITETSSKEFVQRMIDNGHTAMLEHGSVYLFVPWINYFEEETAPKMYDVVINKYSKFYSNHDFSKDDIGTYGAYITTNYRVLYENNWLHLLKYLCKPTEFHDKRVTVRFTCDRGVSHELVRHRVFSFAQESTRYCNYSKDKFGNELTFIMPDKEGWKGSDAYYEMLNCLDEIERIYMHAMKGGVTPQTARAILPNTLKTEVVMTGYMSDWKKFLELRTAPNAHPDMQYLAKKLEKQLKSV